MKRRDVIKLGAVAAGATAGVPGCSVPRLINSMHGEDGAAAFNAMLDEQLKPLDGPGLLSRLVAEQTGRELTPQQTATIREHDLTFRRLLQSVLISQAFRELPEDTQRSEAVQERMWRHLDQIDATVFEIGDMLASLDADQRKGIRTQLQKRPDLPMALGEALDARSARAGVSTGRRMQLRKMMSQTAFRLRNTSPSSIIDEYTEKVDKLRETSPRDAIAIDLAERVNERDFWRRQRLKLDDDPQNPPPSPGGGSGTPPPAPPSPAPDDTTRAPGQVAPDSGGWGAVQPMMAERLTANARAAARSGDCKTVEAIGDRVNKLDPDYYARVFKADPIINACVERSAAVSAPQEDAAKRKHPGSSGLRTGAYMLGIGVLVFGTGVLIATASATSGIAAVGVVMGTVGVVLAGIALIVLLVSAIIYASS
jgi:hypothetical protein